MTRNNLEVHDQLVGSLLERETKVLYQLCRVALPIGFTRTKIRRRASEPGFRVS